MHVQWFETIRDSLDQGFDWDDTSEIVSRRLCQLQPHLMCSMAIREWNTDCNADGSTAVVYDAPSSYWTGAKISNCEVFMIVASALPLIVVRYRSCT
mmetsp:Transcript_37483/g.90890  ORF Transcript_37483/g.90890 Transcript_37483/m.90890 type:complete len:97 (+) Transcript_37483:1035-1325(+)